MHADDSLELADLAAEPVDDGRPFFLEIGKRLDRGAVGSRVLRWSGSAITVVVPEKGGCVRVRDADEPNSELELTQADLAAIAAVVQHWTRERDAWWSFVTTWERGYALPPPPRRYYCLAPGAGAEPVDAGGPWMGAEIRLPMVPGLSLEGTTKTVDIVVRDQRVGPCNDLRVVRNQRPGALPPGTRVGPDGATVGQVLESAGGLLAVARRLTLEVRRCGANLRIFPDDAGIFRELLALLGDIQDETHQ